MAKNLRWALEHASTINNQKEEEELRIKAEAERKMKEQELKDLQEDLYSNLFSYVIYPEPYHMESGIVWAASVEDAVQKVRKEYLLPKSDIDRVRSGIHQIPMNKDVVHIATYIE